MGARSVRRWLRVQAKGGRDDVDGEEEPIALVGRECDAMAGVRASAFGHSRAFCEPIFASSLAQAEPHHRE